MPRVLAPGDRSTVTLDVQNFTGRPGTVPRAGGRHRRSAEPSARAAAACQLNADGAKTTLSFPLSGARGPQRPRKVRVRVDGAADGFKADRRFDLPVRAGLAAA